MENIEHYRKSSFIVGDIIENREKIVSLWLKSEVVLNVLNKYSIESNFFLKHFGYRIVDHVVDVIKESKMIECVPMMYILRVIFRKKDIDENHLFMICDELKSAYKEMFDSDVAKEIVSILDAKIDDSRVQYEKPIYS